MKFFKLFAVAFFLAIASSCTLDKTDFEAELETEVPEYYEFEEAAVLTVENYTIHIEALNGTFYKGYNEIRLHIKDAHTNTELSSSEVTFLPIITHLAGDNASGPHQYKLSYNATEKYYSGYVVFPEESSQGNWQFYISFTDANQVFKGTQQVMVETQTNKNLNMASFIGADSEQYFIALVAPQKPTVAENNLVAGIYKYDKPTTSAGTFPDPSQFSYSVVSNYTLKLDPRMPEPSMGNHSSPNNKDLTQQNDGLYHGVVNYTMTGNWTLNLMLFNQAGQLLKGTVVPTDFTPGVQGVKSELYIDTLF
ncbi:hypothetical protein [Flavobacterium agrisoli]|uniref:YtkA-like protein n=1 Tax=Flavobacterium agrisoli TaxID=2793066 RepID=A0A934PP39_9FLAO|nr:hypothetical protein [Flavobacterium agrisoli]MBK0370445.1 hypothetical protein [Flavobacterium agrisoli]